MGTLAKTIVDRAIERAANLVATEALEATAAALRADIARRDNAGCSHSEEFERGVAFAERCLINRASELRREYENL
jgi:hypothetical protein